jgi:phytol kinase
MTAAELRADLPGALLLSAIFLGLLAAAELWRRFGNPEAEWTRKLVHLAGGFTCLLFPFLVRSPWVVLAMAGALTAIFAAGARLGFLRALHGISRRSRGAELYPLAIFLVYLATRDRPWLYLAAVLVLAVADAFAALIGSRYGVVRYEVEDESKSLEGSLVFLVVAFLAIHLPTLLLTDLPRPVCVLAATLVAALVTGFEAISLRGTDNLFVPLAVVVILAKITSKPLPEIVFQNLSLLAICVVVAVVVARFRSLNVGGAIAYVLFAYGAWSLGNWQWALAPLLGLAAYAAVWFPRARRLRAPGVRVRTVARAVLVPFALVALANGLRQPQRFYGPYLAACATVLAVALAAGVPRAARARPARRLAAAAAAALATAALVALAPWALQRLPLAALGAVALAAAVATALDALYELRRPEQAARREWTAPRFVAAALAAALVLAAQAAGTAPPWDPSWSPRWW